MEHFAKIVIDFQVNILCYTDTKLGSLTKHNKKIDDVKINESDVITELMDY